MHYHFDCQVFKIIYFDTLLLCLVSIAAFKLTRLNPLFSYSSVKYILLNQNCYE